MAGKLTVSTLNNDTGVLATQNGMTGIAKAWVNFNGLSGASPVIRSSFNVSSVTRNATGNYTVSFTTALSDANYSYVASASPAYSAIWSLININSTSAGAESTPTTTSCSVTIVRYDAAVYQDSKYINISVFGS